MNILPLTYLGSTEWYARLLAGNCVIDLHENYVKQSCRNRCEIYSANGVMPLTVNVVKGGSCRKRAVKEMRIDYSKRWQHQHWLSIVSAYKSSPYFDYYAERFAPFYEKRYEFLADLDIDLLLLMLELLGADCTPAFSDAYVIPSAEDCDLRGHGFLSASGNVPSVANSPVPAACSALPEYMQVFAERQPFVAHLSVLDLFFCEGRDAIALLRNSATR